MKIKHLLMFLVTTFVVVVVVVVYYFVNKSPIDSFSELCPTSYTGEKYVSIESTDNVYFGSVWEFHFDISRVKPDKNENNYFDFKQYPLVVYMTTPSGQPLKVDAFYDGKQIFKARVHVTELGKWSYQLKLSGQEISSGHFQVSEQTHGQASLQILRLDDNNKGGLIAGSVPFYWVGGKWFAAQNYAPCNISRFTSVEPSHQRFTDEKILKYLNTLVANKHNAILLKIAQFPLLSDGISWDLAWLQRGEWIVREALKRNIYVQLNLFDTWSRDRNNKLLNNTSGEHQVFNVWKPESSDLYKIKNYLQTIIARFGAYPNIVWELGNEMEHSPNCGHCFSEQAQSVYLPWIREKDSFDHLIGLSEGVWQNVDVDIGFLHQTRDSDFTSLPSSEKPMLMNELVFTDHQAPLWKDSTIRDMEARLAYRRTFWRSFILGLSGSYEATWLNLLEPLNKSVNNVMKDHHRLVMFINTLNIDVNQRVQLDKKVITGSRFTSDVFKYNQSSYVAYLSSKDETPIGIWQMQLFLAKGVYHYRWFDPSSGQWSNYYNITVEHDKRLEISHSSKDLVLVIEKSP